MRTQRRFFAVCCAATAILAFAVLISPTSVSKRKLEIMERANKQALIDKLAKDFGEVSTMFVADYRGLDMPAITELRGKLYEADANFHVVKNTLALRALKEAGVEGIDEMFAGPSAVAFVRGDAAAVAKALKDFAKSSGTLEVRGGIMDGNVVDASQVKEIADLPSREVILTMLVSAINAPMQQVVGVLSAPMRDIVGILDAYIEKRKAAGEE
jgi:large subunit ribosomal protein L10